MTLLLDYSRDTIPDASSSISLCVCLPLKNAEAFQGRFALTRAIYHSRSGIDPDTSNNYLIVLVRPLRHAYPIAISEIIQALLLGYTIHTCRAFSEAAVPLWSVLPLPT